MLTLVACAATANDDTVAVGLPPAPCRSVPRRRRAAVAIRLQVHRPRLARSDAECRMSRQRAGQDGTRNRSVNERIVARGRQRSVLEADAVSELDPRCQRD
jgi:hypothetical protein